MRLWTLCLALGALAAGAAVFSCGFETGGTGPVDAADVPSESFDGDVAWPDDGDVPRPDDAADVAEETSAICGDGTLQAGEECDDGPRNSDSTPDACRTDCRRAHCGDAVVDTGEACDDGNLDETDGCLNDCRRAGCGDGIVQVGEECDDGNADDTDDCLHTCLWATCGDGYVRAGHEECDGPEEPCTMSCGTAGRRACTDCVWGVCAATDTCNALDDDCDGTTDEGFPCVAGTAVACTTDCSTAGTGTCTAACALPTGAACAGPAEACNALDDDCDGSTDEDFVCVAGESGACVNSCGAAGGRTCSASCLWSECCGASEVCPTNCTAGRCDDDCDGTLDEDCPPCNDTCSGALRLTGSGTVDGTNAGGTHDDDVPCGGTAGPDVWYWFDLTQRELVWLDTLDSGYDTVLHLRRGGCTGTEVFCNDDSPCGGSRSSWYGILDPGRYYLTVGGWNGATGAFTLRYQHIPVPGGATEVTRNGDQDADTTGQGNDHTGSCGGGTAPDVDYFIARCADRAGVDAHTCHRDGETDIDTVIYWLGPDGVEMACNDDDGGCSSPGRSRIMDTTLRRGVSVLVVDGHGTEAGRVRTTFGGL